MILSNEKEMLGTWKRVHIIIYVLSTWGLIAFSYSFIYLLMATVQWHECSAAQNTVQCVNKKLTAET